MARLHITNVPEGRRVEVVLSRRNLLTLLHKLDMPGSARMITNNDCWEDGEQTPLQPDDQSQLAPMTLVLRCENDAEHYAKRPAGPGMMHPATERFVRKQGGIPGEARSLPLFGADRAPTDETADASQEESGQYRASSMDDPWTPDFANLSKRDARGFVDAELSYLFREAEKRRWWNLPRGWDTGEQATPNELLERGDYEMLWRAAAGMRDPMGA